MAYPLDIHVSERKKKEEVEFLGVFLSCCYKHQQRIDPQFLRKLYVAAGERSQAFVPKCSGDLTHTPLVS